jgi:hypothetical protein
VNKRKERRNSEVGGAFLIGLAASGDMPYKPCKRRQSTKQTSTFCSSKGNASICSTAHCYFSSYFSFHSSATPVRDVTGLMLTSYGANRANRRQPVAFPVEATPNYSQSLPELSTHDYPLRQRRSRHQRHLEADVVPFAATGSHS